MKYIYQRNLLSINEKILRFQGQIEKVIEFNQMLFVLLLLDKSLQTSQNIFCVSKEGDIIWQVPFIEGHTKFGSPYSYIEIENNLLTAYNTLGFLYSIEPKTGKVLKEEFIK